MDNNSSSGSTIRNFCWLWHDINSDSKPFSMDIIIQFKFSFYIQIGILVVMIATFIFFDKQILDVKEPIERKNKLLENLFIPTEVSQSDSNETKKMKTSYWKLLCILFSNKVILILNIDVYYINFNYECYALCINRYTILDDRLLCRYSSFLKIKSKCSLCYYINYRTNSRSSFWYKM